jgi:hypothetical protein
MNSNLEATKSRKEHLENGLQTGSSPVAGTIFKSLLFVLKPLTPMSRDALAH